MEFEKEVDEICVGDWFKFGNKFLYTVKSDGVHAYGYIFNTKKLPETISSDVKIKHFHALTKKVSPCKINK
jgi:hypothetical protein